MTHSPFLSFRSVSPFLQLQLKQSLEDFKKEECVVPEDLKAIIGSSQEELFIQHHTALKPIVLILDESSDSESEPSAKKSLKRSRLVMEEASLSSYQKKEESDATFRLLAHAILDESLSGSKLEGACPSSFAELFGSYLDKIPIASSTFSSKIFKARLLQAANYDKIVPHNLEDELESYLTYSHG
jgi:hypothetical protein